MNDNQGWCAQGSILGPLFIYIYIYIYIYLNDLSDNLESNVKPFADDASMFEVELPLLS